jgi:hypothetical protein
LKSITTSASWFDATVNVHLQAGLLAARRGQCDFATAGGRHRVGQRCAGVVARQHEAHLLVAAGRQRRLPEFGECAILQRQQIEALRGTQGDVGPAAIGLGGRRALMDAHLLHRHVHGIEAAGRRASVNATRSEPSAEPERLRKRPARPAMPARAPPS